jgi:hypothetical protein
MVEYIEELSLYSELHPLAHRKPFREIEVIPDEIGAAQGVAAEVSKLAMLWVVATDRLRDTRDGMMLIERDARNDARELRSTALHNAVPVG